MSRVQEEIGTFRDKNDKVQKFGCNLKSTTNFNTSLFCTDFKSFSCTL